MLKKMQMTQMMITNSFYGVTLTIEKRISFKIRRDV